MPLETEQLAGSLESLTSQAFEAFCEDITAMFGNAADCSVLKAGQGTLKSELKGDFKKLAAVNQVQAVGAVDGTFQLLLDQAGLFVLAGVFVMLPEKRITETIRAGTLTDADYLNDAIKEVGNLLVGSWDRIFREEVTDHKHFKQVGTFIGPLWDKPEDSIGLSGDTDCHYVMCRITLDDFPAFTCAAVFSDALLTDGQAPETPAAEAPPCDTSGDTEAPSEAAAEQSDVNEQKDQVAQETSSQQSSTDASAEPAARSSKQPQAQAEPASKTEPPAGQSDLGPVSEAIRHLTQAGSQRAPEATSGPLDERWGTLTAADLMNPTALWADPDDTVEEVLKTTQQHNAGYVLVGQDGRLEGLISRSDITAAVSPYLRPVLAHWRRPADDATMKIRIKWFMSRTVHTIGPTASIGAVMEKMIRHSVRGLPVVQTDGRTLGLITSYDVFAALLSRAEVHMTGRPHQAPPAVK